MSWLKDFQFGPMARVVFGVGRAKDAGDLVRELDGTTALIMTDPGVHKVGLTRPIEKSLEHAGIRAELFTGVATEPTLASVNAARDMYCQTGCDIIVAVGGGSSMDSAKAVSLLVGNGGEFHDY